MNSRFFQNAIEPLDGSIPANHKNAAAVYFQDNPLCAQPSRNFPDLFEQFNTTSTPQIKGILADTLQQHRLQPVSKVQKEYLYEQAQLKALTHVIEKGSNAKRELHAQHWTNELRKGLANTRGGHPSGWVQDSLQGTRKPVDLMRATKTAASLQTSQKLGRTLSTSKINQRTGKSPSLSKAGTLRKSQSNSLALPENALQSTAQQEVAPILQIEMELDGCPYVLNVQQYDNPYLVSKQFIDDNGMSEHLLPKITKVVIERLKLFHEFCSADAEIRRHEVVRRATAIYKPPELKISPKAKVLFKFELKVENHSKLIAVREGDSAERLAAEYCTIFALRREKYMGLVATKINEYISLYYLQNDQEQLQGQVQEKDAEDSQDQYYQEESV